MRLFTDGKRVELLTSHGQVSWTPKGKPSLADSGTRDASVDQRDGLLVMGPGGTDLSADADEADLLDAIALSKTDVAALINEDDVAHLVIGPIGEWQRDIALGDVDGPAIAWPAGLIWAESVTATRLYDEADGIGISFDGAGPVALSANSHGCAVTSVDSGLVAVIRPGHDAVDFAMRLPSQPEARLYAEPSAKGVIVTLIIEGRDGAVLHLAEDGRVLASRAALSPAPAVLLGDRVIIYDHNEQTLHLCDLDLTSLSSKALSFAPVESTVAANGKAFALANDSDLALCTVTSKGRISVASHIDYAEELSAARKRAAAKRLRDTYDPKRAHGSPALGFPAGRQPPPWIVQANQPLALKLLVRSTGGKGRGMFVALEGEALRSLELSHAEVAGVTVPFESTPQGVRANIPDVELVQGLRYPLDPSPKNDKHKDQAQKLLAATHFSLTVHGHAREPSRELLRVILGALESRASPMKWMRPLIVEGPSSPDPVVA